MLDGMSLYPGVHDLARALGLYWAVALGLVLVCVLSTRWGRR